MKLENLLFYSIFFSAFFASLSLILSPQIHFVHKIGFLLGLGLALAYRYFRMSLNRWYFNSGAIIALVSSLIYGIWFAEYPIQAAIYFLGWVILVRLFQLQSLRDYKFALILSLFEISAGSLMTVQFRYLIIFLAWLIASAFCLSMITLSSKSYMQKPVLSPSRLLSLLASAGIASLLIGFLLFFFLPRVGYSLISFQLGSGRAWSGYSSEIRLGEVSELMENQTPVMRARLLDQTGPIDGLKWRIRAMEHYENNTWEDRSGVFEKYLIYYNQPVTIEPHPPAGKNLTQEIFLLPELGSDLASAGWAYAYLLPYQYRSFSCSFNHYCSLSYPPSEMFHYIVYSILPDYSENEIRASLSVLPEEMERRNLWLKSLLELPEGSEQICGLAQEVIGKETDPVKKLSMLKDFFQIKFKYSLVNLPTGENPVQEFLFKTREGNCEYFASASVLMLRCMGIPSRLVVGFLAGEWNPYQSYYLVRQSHAHTWVEIYLPGLGFMDFDPTPSGARDSRKGPSWLWKIVDPIIFAWNRWVVDFSIQDQIRGFRRIEAESYRLKYQFKFSVPAIRSWLKAKPMIAIVIAFLGTIAVFLGFWLGPRRSAEHVRLKNLSPEQKQVVKIYLRMFKILRKKGYVRDPCFTGLELSEKFSHIPEAKTIIQSLTDFYYRVRFGNGRLDDENLKRAQEDLKFLKKTISCGK